MPTFKLKPSHFERWSIKYFLTSNGFYTFHLWSVTLIILFPCSNRAIFSHWVPVSFCVSSCVVLLTLFVFDSFLFSATVRCPRLVYIACLLPNQPFFQRTLILSIENIWGARLFISAGLPLLLGFLLGRARSTYFLERENKSWVHQNYECKLSNFWVFSLYLLCWVSWFLKCDLCSYHYIDVSKYSTPDHNAAKWQFWGFL